MTTQGKQHSRPIDTSPVYKNGFFVYNKENAPHYWLACLVTLRGGTVSTGRSYRIFAPTGRNLEKTECEQVRIVAKSVDRKVGAYELW